MRFCEKFYEQMVVWIQRGSLEFHQKQTVEIC